MYTRFLEYARDVYGWLESGAYCYACDDKQRLATTIRKALVSMVQLENGASPEEAEAYVDDLQQQLRLEEVF